MTDDATVDIELPARPQASRLARLALDGWLNRTVGPSRADDVRLAAVEIVSNAIRHAGLRADETVRLSTAVDDGSVRVEVEQPTPAADVRIVPEPERAVGGGFGLVLVDRIADRWGAERGPPGRVWFEIDRD
jgi:anti-sigma regulatory factor (Ser/Thr protein kinase)